MRVRLADCAMPSMLRRASDKVLERIGNVVCSFSSSSEDELNGARRRPFSTRMKIVRIPKGSGGFRTIYCPSADEKVFLKPLVPHLNEAAVICDKHDVMHGFMPGRSPVTNAKAHRGFEYTLSFDLKDFFDSVTRNHVGTANTPLADWPCGTLDTCFVDGAARQGLPTSPALANIAAAPMVNEIMGLRRNGRFGWTFTFTIYADDLTFSFDRFATGDWLKQEIPALVERHGFTINPKKTHLQCAVNGRRMITGVAVDDEVHVPRYIKRKIRAAEHQKTRGWKARNQLRGLREWMLLKLPVGYVPRKEPLQIGTMIKSIPIAAGHAASTFGSWVRKIIE